jgi:hypothetical protein
MLTGDFVILMRIVVMQSLTEVVLTRLSVR